MKIYCNGNGGDPIEFQQKHDDSPVTAADLASNRVIVEGLRAFSPNIPILSEENATDCDWKVRQHWHRFWLVDPLDGTKEFLRHNGEFTVNVALIEHEKPVMGVVYAPATDLLYAAVNNRAWKIDANGKKSDITVKDAWPPLAVVSRSHGDNQERHNYLSQLKDYRILQIGSSMKFCLVAEGSAQLYPNFSPTSIWDTAAGHVVAVAAGAQVTDWKGSPLDYTPRESFLNPGFLVSLV